MTDLVVTVTPQPTLSVTVGDVSSVGLLYTGKLAYTLTAGVTFALGEVGYIHTDGTVLKAQSDGTVTEANATVICIVAAGILSGASGLFASAGFVSGLSGGTAGSLAYLSGTAGAITTAQPTTGFPKPIGRWLTSTLLHFFAVAEVSRPVSTDNALMRYDGTGGVPQDSLVIVTDAGATSGITSLVMAGALSGVTTLANSGIQTNSNATDATNLTSGASQNAGGASITKALWVGGLSNIAGVATFQNNIVQSGATTLATGTGTVSLNGNVVIASTKTLTVTPSIVSNSTGSILEATQASTSAKYFRASNNGADGYFGIESSGAGGFFTGSAAYDTVVWTGGRLFLRGATGVAVNGAATFSSTITTTSGIIFANETLANYDEGTFTPTFAGTGTAGTFTYESQLGRYTRVGDKVSYTLHVQISAISVSPTGDLTISGFPFAAAGGRHVGAIGIQANITQTATYTQFGAYGESGESRLYITEFKSAAGLAFTPASALGAAGNYVISGTYEVS